MATIIKGVPWVNNRKFRTRSFIHVRSKIGKLIGSHVGLGIYQRNVIKVVLGLVLFDLPYQLLALSNLSTRLYFLFLLVGLDIFHHFHLMNFTIYLLSDTIY